MNFHNGYNLAITYINELNNLNDMYDADQTPSMQEVLDCEWSYFIRELMILLDKLYLVTLQNPDDNYDILFERLLWDYGIWVGEFWEEETEYRDQILKERIA